MSLSDAFHAYIVRNFSFPLSSYLMNRRGILSHYKSCVASENLPYERLQEIQLEKFVNVIKYANTWVPYYQKKFQSIGLQPEDLKSLADAEQIPPLTRQDVIEHRQDMVDKRFAASRAFADSSTRGPAEPLPFARFRKHKLVKNTSSGSTGAPTIFYEDGSITALNWAHELRFRKWFGIDPGAKEARLARITVDYMPKSASLRLRRYLWNQLILPGVNLQERDYDLCARRINEFRPRVMWGFTSALTGLAEYLKNNPAIAAYSPELIITWAAPLYDHERKILTEVFRCPITNIYGAREVGHVAAQCNEGTFHINQESYLVETTPVEDNTSRDAETGELLVTPLITSPMPFIRYRMGDIGKVSRSQCHCGKSLQELQSFLGRTGEVFKTKDGRMISPNFWCRTFMDAKLAGSIKRFQVIYLKDGNIRIKLVTKENYSKDTENHFRAHLKRNFQEETEVHFDYVNEIKPQLSGKYQMVMKEQ